MLRTPFISTTLAFSLISCTADNPLPTSAGQGSSVNGPKAGFSYSNPGAVWTVVNDQSAMFSGDGLDYVNGECGIEAQIYYSNYDPEAGVGGDATLDNLTPGSRKPPCAARSIRVILNGASRNVPFINVRRVLNLAVDESTTQNFQMWVEGQSGCERLAWHTVADGGAGGQIVVTRTAYNTWTATTTGTGRCYAFSGQRKVWGSEFPGVQVSFVIREQKSTAP